MQCLVPAEEATELKENLNWKLTSNIKQLTTTVQKTEFLWYYSALWNTQCHRRLWRRLFPKWHHMSRHI